MNRTKSVFWKRSLLTAGLLAVSGAALITYLFQPQPLEDKLLHLHVSESMPGMAQILENEPAELQILIVSYTQDPILAAKAQLALERYRELARPVLLAYGHEPDFQSVLIRYGEDVILPIHYFLTHDALSLQIKHEVGILAEKTTSALNTVKGWFGKEVAQAPVERAELTPELRGWYAVESLERNGYNFLGQFKMDDKGEVIWLQTERTVEALSSWFTSGVAGLEEKIQMNQKVGVGDVAWAGVDFALGAGALKVARLSKRAGKSSHAAASSSRSATVGSAMLGQSKLGSRMAKYGRPAALTLTAVRHPSVFNSMLGKLGAVLKLPVAAMQMAGWAIVLKALFFLMIFLLRPLLWLLIGVWRLFGWAYKQLHGKPFDVLPSNATSETDSASSVNGHTTDRLQQQLDQRLPMATL